MQIYSRYIQYIQTRYKMPSGRRPGPAQARPKPGPRIDRPGSVRPRAWAGPAALWYFIFILDVLEIYWIYFIYFWFTFVSHFSFSGLRLSRASLSPIHSCCSLSSNTHTTQQQKVQNKYRCAYEIYKVYTDMLDASVQCKYEILVLNCRFKSTGLVLVVSM